MAQRDAVDPGLDGVLILDKPTGPTSHDIVALVRRLSGVRRVGHGGTLDPFAAGVLPVFLGRATRMVEYHMADEKAYRALVVFGARSTTDDLDGELSPSEAPAPDRQAVESALEPLRGWIEQVPPDHSAVRIGGRRAYEMARHGEKPVLKPRRVEIRSLELLAWDDSEPSRPTAILEVRCSAGTYIRAIARDLGESLGSGAHLAALTRTASGPFSIDEAHSLDRARDVLASGKAAELLLPPDVGLEAYPRLELSVDELATLAKGQPVRHRGSSQLSSGPSGLLRVVDADGRLAAMARYDAGKLHPEKVFITPGR
ncbi:MAG: tRNA pseudouridine(55) synthase TruB [Chloroflexota bacterium]|nr:tRNA pseudouridine(55) synthase TruB [Chloroflexota bacterium]